MAWTEESVEHQLHAAVTAPHLRVVLLLGGDPVVPGRGLVVHVRAPAVVVVVAQPHPRRTVTLRRRSAVRKVLTSHFSTGT